MADPHKGRWVALNLQVVDSDAARELSRAISGDPLTKHYARTRYDGIRAALGLPPLPRAKD